MKKLLGIFGFLTMASPALAREFRVHAVQAKWQASDYQNAPTFQKWMRSQMEMVKPNLRTDRPNLVVLTELNGLPLAIQGSFLAQRAPSLQLALAASLIKHLPEAFAWSVQQNAAGDVVRGLMLSQTADNMKLYLTTCAELAREYKVYLLCGSNPQPHLNGNGSINGKNIYNQAVLLDPQGKVLAAWDKVYPTKSETPLGIVAGQLDEIVTVPTPVGDIGVATSLDAFKLDVIGKLVATGTNVLLQPDANGAVWTGTEQGVATKRDQPVAWLESSWQAVQTTNIQYAINSMVVGNLFDVSFDGQSSIIGKAEKYPTQQSYVLTEPRGGFIALLPWVESGSAEQLKELGKKLAAGSKDPRENQYKSGTIYADLSLPDSVVAAHTLRPFEVALQQVIDGRAISNPLWFVQYTYFLLAAIFLFLAWLTKRFMRWFFVVLALIFLVLKLI